MPGRTAIEGPGGTIGALWTPTDSGFVAASMADPAAASASSGLAAGVLQVIKIPVPANERTRAVAFMLHQALVTPASYNGVGLYIPQGTSNLAALVAQTADQAATGFIGAVRGVTANWQVGGVDTPVSVGGPYVWVGFLTNAATPFIPRGIVTTLAQNFGLATGGTPATGFRAFTTGAGLTALPATVDVTAGAIGGLIAAGLL